MKISDLLKNVFSLTELKGKTIYKRVDVYSNKEKYIISSHEDSKLSNEVLFSKHRCQNTNRFYLKLKFNKKTINFHLYRTPRTLFFYGFDKSNSNLHILFLEKNNTLCIITSELLLSKIKSIPLNFDFNLN